MFLSFIKLSKSIPAVIAPPYLVFAIFDYNIEDLDGFVYSKTLEFDVSGSKSDINTTIISNVSSVWNYSDGH